MFVPQLARSAGGQWTLAYAGPAQAYWLIWARSSEGPEWSNTGDMPTTDFPTTADAMNPGSTWWQIKVCGEGDNNS